MIEEKFDETLWKETTKEEKKETDYHHRDYTEETKTNELELIVDGEEWKIELTEITAGWEKKVCESYSLKTNKENVKIDFSMVDNNERMSEVKLKYDNENIEINAELKGQRTSVSDWGSTYDYSFKYDFKNKKNSTKVQKRRLAEEISSKITKNPNLSTRKSFNQIGWLFNHLIYHIKYDHEKEVHVVLKNAEIYTNEAYIYTPILVLKNRDTKLEDIGDAKPKISFKGIQGYDERGNKIADIRKVRNMELTKQEKNTMLFSEYIQQTMTTGYTRTVGVEYHSMRTIETNNINRHIENMVL